VGTFETDIEIWNLDVLDVLYPVAVLGSGESKQDPRNKTTSTAPKVANNEYHVDSVLGLAWNKSHRYKLKHLH
jgi:periodic tryptophan protein 1